jgi:hypothetical protein
MRTLEWHNNLGCVIVELEFDNGKFQFKCQPVHAILIGYFDETSNYFNNIWDYFSQN